MFLTYLGLSVALCLLSLPRFSLDWFLLDSLLDDFFLWSSEESESSDEEDEASRFECFFEPISDSKTYTWSLI